MNIEDTNSNDAVNIAPHLHNIIFEDDKLRVLKVTVKPGDVAAMHWHPHNINYVLTGGKLHLKKEDGSSVEVDLHKGQVTSSPAGSHAVKNIGDSEVSTVQIELK